MQPPILRIWLLKYQKPYGDLGGFLYLVLKWTVGVVAVVLFGIAANRYLGEEPNGIVFVSLGVVCLVPFLILFIRDARENRREAEQIEERWASVGEPPHPPNF